MQKDWEAVAAAINARMSDLGLMQLQLAERSGVSVAALRLLQKAKSPNAKARTLSSVSEALDWPRDHLAAVRDGQVQVTAGSTRQGETLPSLAELVRTVSDLQSRVEALEQADRG
ncbi:XRE family transcriptional regulator [Lentzea tibetensis]|uniref:XRE family transcriptional regulator n=1 Tax=Lentzea tibetensis TaxID=2591470 RepID=A0A563EVA5_9PSEU|nr:XRE family transcriptional regulator [Lentzea tibetensis]TWP51478.1 XRE family transcriptional regulator [Lentzea tibetensis]